MADISDKVSVYNNTGRVRMKKIQNMGHFIAIRSVLLVALTIIWYFAYKHYDCELILPSPLATAKAFFAAITSVDVLTNLGITLIRVIKGFGYAMAIGVPLGLLMGSFKTINEIVEGFIDSLRQVPIMAWVPLTIVWFGLGDGPTIFLIAFAGVFPIILNTIQGVHNISKDYYYAARSMGANSFGIFVHIIIPAAIPDILTGARIAISSGWMSVIWAEFIATSAGFGFSMVKAQTEMQTDMLIALMILAAIVGFAIDRLLTMLNRVLTRWRFV